MEKNIAMEKSCNQYEEDCRGWESRALIAEDKVTVAEERDNSFEKKYTSLFKKNGLEFKKLIQVYHESDEFTSLIDSHDEEIRPVNMSIGWNKAVKTVHSKYPNVVDPDFICGPLWT